VVCITFAAMTMYRNTRDFAQESDQTDELSRFREQFYIPKVNGSEIAYFCGNSLGLQPKTARAAVEQEMEDWQNLGVEGHVNAKNPWLYYHKFLTAPAAKIVGAKEEEVVVMNNLTTNLHLMMVSFYRPAPGRFKILIEGGAFSSDQYAVESQARFHGYKPKDAIIELRPREGEYTLRTSDIIKTIEENASEIALVLLGGVNYYTGQAFDMEAITSAAHKAGAVAGFDLAHAAGNLLLELHKWDVDFATWCSYKYLNSGPGGTSGVFVHERHGNDHSLPRFAGWWGYEEDDRFKMKKGFRPMKGAAGWQLSNAQIFPMAIHKASLEIFEQAGMQRLRKKSEKLTGYLEFILKDINAVYGKELFRILTPSDPAARGCQLSVVVSDKGKDLFNYLVKNNVIVDWREPDVIRISPAPLYNRFTDVYLLGEKLREYLKTNNS
jgi:kynureninase